MAETAPNRAQRHPDSSQHASPAETYRERDPHFDPYPPNVAKGRSVLFVAHARELVKQCSDKLRRFCVPHGIIMRGEVPTDHHPVQVASKGTILSWIQLPV